MRRQSVVGSWGDGSGHGSEGRSGPRDASRWPESGPRSTGWGTTMAASTIRDPKPIPDGIAANIHEVRGQRAMPDG
jgi:hypothetical protein